ncbi:uncharacterized protein [Venturia canescens]|uniref:uncharacterized protein n=1 Tax=Venturia canescens TaxID=32260 RepID=UPI001C9C8939|nr:uncharacterized protein LOC122408245 [Venturia canescens]
MVLKRCGGGSIIHRRELFNVENGADYDAGKRTTSTLAQIVQVLEERDTKWILGLITYNIVIIYHLREWVTATNSVGLYAYANMICFDICALSVCLVSVWVEQNSRARRNNLVGESRAIPIGAGPSRFVGTSGLPGYCGTFHSRFQVSFKDFPHGEFEKRATFLNGGEKNEKVRKHASSESEGNENFVYKSISSLGLEKYEVFALLVSACLSLLAGSLLSAKVVARLTDQPKVHTGRLGLGILLGFLAHLGTIVGYPDAGLDHVVCKALPCPTLRGCNPILGGNMISGAILSVAYFVIHFWKIHSADTAAAFAVLALTASSMLPLAFYTFNIILQRLPRCMYKQLDECLREALIIDGVVEFRNERFWTKSFGKLAGTLQVRIRQNSNESHVLNCVMLRLSKIVSTLTIEEFREARNNDISGDDPSECEYYINEILSSRDENIDAASWPNYRASTPTFEEHVSLLRIEDIIAGDNFRLETVPEKPRKADISCRVLEKRKNFKNHQKSIIFKYKNIFYKDYLWRGDWTKKNALFSGTQIDFERFHHFFVPPQTTYHKENETFA